MSLPLNVQPLERPHSRRATIKGMAMDVMRNVAQWIGRKAKGLLPVSKSGSAPFVAREPTWRARNTRACANAASGFDLSRQNMQQFLRQVSVADIRSKFKPAHFAQALTIWTRGTPIERTAQRMAAVPGWGGRIRANWRALDAEHGTRGIEWLMLNRPSHFSRYLVSGSVADWVQLLDETESAMCCQRSARVSPGTASGCK